MNNPFITFAGHLMRRCRALRRDESAATAVEFALLSFPFFLIVAGILQTSVIFLATQVLESAVQDASRHIRTGQIQKSGTSLETFREQICGRLISGSGRCGYGARHPEPRFRAPARQGR